LRESGRAFHSDGQATPIIMQTWHHYIAYVVPALLTWQLKYFAVHYRSCYVY